MNRVFVLSSTKKPLMPCSPARVRRLLKAGKAAVFRLQPFTLILKFREDGATQPIEFKVDPGSKTTGIALVAEFQRGKTVVFAANLAYRGAAIYYSEETAMPTPTDENRRATIRNALAPSAPLRYASGLGGRESSMTRFVDTLSLRWSAKYGHFLRAEATVNALTSGQPGQPPVPAPRSARAQDPLSSGPVR